MPKQRSTRTIADVKESLRQAGNNRGQTDNTPRLEMEYRRVAKEQGAQTQDVNWNEATAPTGQEGQEPTPTPTLQRARQDADAPLTVEEKGKTSQTAPAPSVPRRETKKE